MSFVSPGLLSNANKNNILLLQNGPESPSALKGTTDVDGSVTRSMSRRAREMFAQDSMVQSEEICEYSKLRQVHPEVKWAQFLEVFGYYVLFTFVCGPLSLLLLSIKPGWNFLSNIHLSPAYPRFYGFLFFFLINWMSYIYTYLNLDCNYSLIPVTVHYVLTLILLAMVSFNFAVYHPNLYKLMKGQKICEDISFKECLVEGPWFKEETSLFYEELQYSIQRMEVDLSMFYLNFTINLPADLVSKLQGNIEKLSVFHRRTSVAFQPNCLICVNGVSMIYAHSVILEFFEAFRRRNHNRSIKISAGAVFIFIAGFSTALTFSSGNHKTAFEVIFKLLLISCKSFCCAIFAWLLLVLRKDLKRRLFLLVQMSYLILTQKRLQEFEEEILMPNLNLFCPMNLKCWQNLRAVTQDLGKKHFLKHDMNLSLILVLSLGSLTLLIFTLFNLVEIRPDEIMIILSKSIIFFFIIISVMLNGAYINEHFRIHKSILERGKGVCTDLVRLGDFYFNEKTTAQNFMYRFGIGIMRVNFGNDQKKINQHLENLIGIYNTGIVDLKYDEVYRPFVLLGITISLPLMRSIIFGLLSLMLAGLQEFIKRAIRK